MEEAVTLCDSYRCLHTRGCTSHSARVQFTQRYCSYVRRNSLCSRLSRAQQQRTTAVQPRNTVLRRFCKRVCGRRLEVQQFESEPSGRQLTRLAFRAVTAANVVIGAPTKTTLARLLAFSFIVMLSYLQSCDSLPRARAYIRIHCCGVTVCHLSGLQTHCH